MDNASPDVIRFECLKLATEVMRFGIMQTPEEIVARAKAYEEFIQGSATAPNS